MNHCHCSMPIELTANSSRVDVFTLNVKLPHEPFQTQVIVSQTPLRNNANLTC